MVALKDVLTIFQKCNSLYRSFQDEHLLLLARVQSIANMIERLPALANPAFYRLFSSDPNLHVEVSKQQLKVVETTWEAALESLCGLPEVHRCQHPKLWPSWHKFHLSSLQVRTAAAHPTAASEEHRASDSPHAEQPERGSSQQDSRCQSKYQSSGKRNSAHL